jgi:peroxiredoxin
MRLLLPAMLGCLLMVACSSSRYLDPPRPIPALAAPNQYGEMVSLKEACSGPWAVVFFYPEADTPG